MFACIYVTILILQAVAVNAQNQAILSVANVIPGATATFECSLPSLTSPTSLHVSKDNVALYTCTNIAFRCSKTTVDNDYSDVMFTGLGTALAKGTFTVANADQVSDGGDWTCKYGSSLISPPVNFVVSAQSPATLSVKDVLHAATATFECSFPRLRSPTTLDIYKDSVALYQCTDIALTCSKSSSDNDYSYVTFTHLSTPSAKGTFTVANAYQTRDGGNWTCKYGTSLISSSVNFVVTAQSPATLRVANVKQGATATFEFSYPNLESPKSLHVYKGSVALYKCTNISSTCSKSSPDNDYSDVTFTGLSTASAKGTCTVANADHTRDGGEWKCKYGSSLISSSVTFVVSDYCSWCFFYHHISCWLCIVYIIILIIGVIIVIVVVVRVLWWWYNRHKKKTLCWIPICNKQQTNDCQEDDGRQTVTAGNLSPDTNNTIYLEDTNKDEKLCKEASMQKQTMKAPTEKPKGLSPLERGSAAGYTPRHVNDCEETHNKRGPLPSIKKFTGIPESSDGHNTRSHSITDKDSMKCKVHVQD